jgi:ribonuclease HI
MPEHPTAPQDYTANNDSIRILQINLNKSEKAHLDILNVKVSQLYDIMLIQEPYATAFQGIRTPTNFRPVFPSNRFQSEDSIRSVIWVNRKIDTKNWLILDIPGTSDITAIQLKGPYGTLSIFNIYNDCTHSRNETTLRRYIHDNAATILATENHHMLLAGDFNRHHPLWDDDENTHLFTQQATRQAEGLINMIAAYDLNMPLPKGIPTLQHMVSKRYSRPDNVFNTPGLSELITKCEVDPSSRPACTDHFPILTNILLPQERISSQPTHNFREVDWDNYRHKLRTKLLATPDPQVIADLTQLTEAAECLTQALQETIHEEIPKTKPRPDAKRWWNGDLRKRKREINRLRVQSYRFRALANHPSHEELRVQSGKYGDAIIQAKRQHWADYLEEMTSADIWSANKFIREPAGDGGSPRIPTLKVSNDQGGITQINDNEDKAKTFVKTFFPPPPPQANAHEHFEYPEPLPDPPQVSTKQILAHIAKLSPYKAHGPDGIPNIVLQKCSDLIADRLTRIYRAIIDLGLYYDPWREFTTVVLRKPNKPNYEIPKAYRPIALISTMAKVLTSIVAANLSKIVEQHHLLPKTHFGGRPGRSTVDAIQYLVHKISSAWRENKVASVLFLDVEGAFPNAVTTKLVHNLKKRSIPTSIVKFVEQLLTNRRTILRFDDYTSESINISNGIGQGDPLSMLLYILYNADLLDLPDNPASEDAIGYVDDIALLSTGTDFEESTNRLKDMMTKEDGGLQWSISHNSRFEVTKSVIMHFTRKTVPDPDNENGRIPPPKPTLTLNHQAVQEVSSFKYLGIQIDSQLRWKEQTQRATANATKWILQFRRLTRVNSGVKAKLMRQLYLAVALPKITYGIDVWYTPPTKPAGYTKNIGSAGALRNFQKVQRIATLAITGTLRTSPNDFVDLHAGTYPMELALLKACHSAMVRFATLPNSHPLHQIIRKARHHPPAKHLSPLDKLIKQFSHLNTKIETIQPAITLTRLNPRIKIHIDPNREDSIKSESTDSADFKIFSDGSGHDDGIGSAALIYEKNRSRPLRSLQYYLGTPDKHNTYEAEAAGAILALWILRTTPETIGKKVSLYIDNQSVISALSTPKSTSGQHLLNSLRLSVNDVGCELSIRWISSHSKVKGNEDVDNLAKVAAEGRSSASASLPHLFRTPLPSSASAIKQDFNTKLKAKWAAIWNTSPRKPRIAQFGGSFPFSKFMKSLHLLTRKQASTILQLRCGHIPLNAYLHKIDKSDTDRCPACDIADPGNSPRETVNHFLFDCPAHEVAREEFTDKLEDNFLHLSTIMTDADRMKDLVTYVNRTRRLRQ